MLWLSPRRRVRSIRPPALSCAPSQGITSPLSWDLHIDCSAPPANNRREWYPRSPRSPRSQSPMAASGRLGSLALLLLVSSTTFLAWSCGADVIGDGRASDSSSQEFFASLDTNLDGTVEASEMLAQVANFGGKSLDEPDEILRSARGAFDRLDANRDGTLTAAESTTFWRHLGSMLSVSEVADWIEYGVQLPSETSELFRQNAVTGYDFAELVADDGAALAHELGIHRAAYQKKLLRSMRMLMSGVGVAPDKPQVPVAEAPPYCGALRLRWGRADGRGFPVHKYRVFRLVPPATGASAATATTVAASASKSSTAGTAVPTRETAAAAAAAAVTRAAASGAVASSNGGVGSSTEQPLLSSSGAGAEKSADLGSSLSSSSSTSSSNGGQWALVYDGPELETVDTGGEFGLKAGATFEYKIEAWSLFGRSDAAIFSGRTPLHDPSTVTSSGSGGTGVSCEANSGELLSSSSSLLHQGWLGTLTGAIWQILAWLSSALTFLLTWASPLFGLITALMRIRRSSLSHKHDAADRAHGELTWRLLRFLAVVIPGGAYLIPVSLRTDPATEDPSLYALRNDGTASPAAVGTLGIKNALPPEMRQKTMNPGAGGGGRGSYQGVVGNKNSAVADKKPIACGQCVKPFKWTLKGGRVSKHTCSQCWAVFCGSKQCGYVNHLSLVTCPVGGGCLCKNCHDRLLTPPPPVVHKKAPPNGAAPASTTTTVAARAGVGGGGVTTTAKPTKSAAGSPRPAPLLASRSMPQVTGEEEAAHSGILEEPGPSRSIRRNHSRGLLLSPQRSPPPLVTPEAERSISEPMRTAAAAAAAAELRTNEQTHLQRRSRDLGPRSQSDLGLGLPGLPGGRNYIRSELDDYHLMDNSRRGADSSSTASVSSNSSTSSTSSNGSNSSNGSSGRRSSFSRRPLFFGGKSSKNSDGSREASLRRATSNNTSSGSTGSNSSSSSGRQRWHRLMSLHKKSRSAQDLASGDSHQNQNNNHEVNNDQPPPLERIISANSNSSAD